MVVAVVPFRKCADKTFYRCAATNGGFKTHRRNAFLARRLDCDRASVSVENLCAIGHASAGARHMPKVDGV